MASQGFRSTTLSPDAAAKRKFVIVRTAWNSDITERLFQSAKDTLTEYGASVNDIEEYVVPGAFELVYTCGRLAHLFNEATIIAIGCVIRGDTPHFDYICQGVTQGLAQLNAEGDNPIVYGVLTVNTHQQAVDRVDGTEGDKGREFALTAITMSQFQEQTRITF